MSRSKKGGRHVKGNPSPLTKRLPDTHGISTPARAYYDQVEKWVDMVVISEGEHLRVHTTHIEPLYQDGVFQGVAIMLLTQQAGKEIQHEPTQ